MEIVLERPVQGSVVAAVCRRNGELVVTADLHDPRPSFATLTDLAQVVWTKPLVVAGRLPKGAEGVRVLWPGDWADVLVRDEAWLGVAEEVPVSEQPIWALAFACKDGSFDPIPEPGSEERSESPKFVEPNDEASAYAATLADAIAADIAHDTLPGPLRRLVLRWFWEGDPLYLTIHALAAGDPQPDTDDAWYPLEWGLDEREFARTDRVLARLDVREKAAALTATFREVDDSGGVDGMAHVPAVIEVVRQLPDALAAHGVTVTERFAAVAAHFEGWGVRDSLDATASEELRAALEDNGELPVD